jgi:hypothetical protein
MALLSPGANITALRELFGELLRDRNNVRHVADLMAGADIRYDTRTSEPPHPMAGRWMPDLILPAGNTAARVAGLLHPAMPILLDLAGRTDLAETAKGWMDRIKVITAPTADRPADAVLIRPDGYVAWAAGSETPRAADGLQHTLQTWFGAPAQPHITAEG